MKLLYLDRNVKKSYEYYGALLNYLKFDKSQYKTISEYPGCDFYIDLKDFKYTFCSDEYWSLYRELDIFSIVSRCRVLRSLTLTESRDLIMRALFASFEFFNNNRYIDHLVTICVDRYTLDIFTFVALKFEVKVTAIGGSFIPKTRRITLKGEMNDVRIVDVKELDSILRSLNDRSYLTTGKSTNVKQLKLFLIGYISDVCKYIFHYWILHRLFRKLNFHYLLAKGISFKSILNLCYTSKYFTINSLSKLIGLHNKESIYIPLHYHPEATLDYWAISLNESFYLETLCEVISFYNSRGIKVYLKEHPAMHYKRNISFYKTLLSFEKVELINSFIESSALFDFFDNIVIWQGSSGLEYVNANKNVYTYFKPYYDSGLMKSYKDYPEESKMNLGQVRFVFRNFLESVIYYK